jgi:hypothetical protein
MSIGYPSVIALCILAIGLLSSRPILFYSFFAAGAFGSLSILPTDSIGGMTLLPQPIFALALLAKTISEPGAIPQGLRLVDDWGKLGLLFAFLAAGIVITMIAPKLFVGQIIITPMRLTGTTDLETDVLVPNSANMTQLAYLTLSILTALTFAILAKHADFLKRLPLALLIGGIVLFLTGVADWVAGSSGALEPFRNASYALLTNAEVLDMKRVVGLMPEASAFGPACVAMAAFLIFLRAAMPGCGLGMPMLVTGYLLLGMAVMSTSSTAYVALAVFGAIYGASLLLRGVAPARQPGAASSFGLELLVIGLLFIAGIIALFAVHGLTDTISNLLNDIIFQKGQSASYYGRKSWTDTSLGAFFASYGLGVGIGSTRTSSWAVAVLSSTGIIGTALLAAFFVRLFITRAKDPDSPAASTITALKLALPCALAPMAISGTMVDFGSGVAAIFGIVIGLAARDEEEPSPKKRIIPGPVRRTSGRDMTTGFEAKKARPQRA